MSANGPKSRLRRVALLVSPPFTSPSHGQRDNSQSHWQYAKTAPMTTREIRVLTQGRLIMFHIAAASSPVVIVFVAMV